MNCIYCLKDFAPQDLTDEHVIPLALGGLLVLKKAACSNCNSKVVNKCDAFLNNIFPPTLMARSELDLRGHSGKQPQIELSGMDPVLGKVDMIMRKVPKGAKIIAKSGLKKKGKDFVCIAATERQCLQMLSKAVGRDIKLSEIGDKGLIKATSFETKEPVDWNLAHRAVAKVFYCYLLLELGEQILHTSPMAVFREYFLSAAESAKIAPDFRSFGWFDVPAHYHVLMFDSGCTSNNGVCLFGGFWFRFSLDLSVLAPHGRHIAIDPVNHEITEQITKYRGNWHQRTSIKWGWKR
jgi:hypothetical protein